MLKSFTQANILEGLKRLDHVFYSLPVEGGKAALSLKDDEDRGGYGFLHYLKDEFTVPLEDAPTKGFDAESLGSLWTFEDEDAQVKFHGVYNHSMTIGWHPAAYEIVQRKLDEWWEENEDGIVRPCRTLILGRGGRLAQIAKPSGGTSWNVNQGFAVMANTEIEFAAFWDPED